MDLDLEVELDPHLMEWDLEWDLDPWNLPSGNQSHLTNQGQLCNIDSLVAMYCLSSNNMVW